MPKIKGLKFGDIVINHWASKSNPMRIGVFVRNQIRQKRITCQFTDTKGKFWNIFNDKESKFEKIGSIFSGGFNSSIDENK